MVLLQLRSRSARFDAVVRITGYEGLLCLYWVRLVGLEGFEPPTHGLGNRCSILLSYRPMNGGSLNFASGFEAYHHWAGDVHSLYSFT
jgi:hypothetical protein